MTEFPFPFTPEDFAQPWALLVEIIHQIPVTTVLVILAVITAHGLRRWRWSGLVVDLLRILAPLFK